MEIEPKKTYVPLLGRDISPFTLLSTVILIMFQKVTSVTKL